MPGTDIMTHLPTILRPDPSRTVIRPFYAHDLPEYAERGRSRVQRIVDRVMTLDEEQLAAEITRVIGSLEQRHLDVQEALLRNFREVDGMTLDRASVSPDRALLIGAYFSEEYSFEAAALFNPSIVLHPDQDGMANGTIRFALSLRGIGEGHVSSVTFRTGTWHPAGDVRIDPPSAMVVSPQIQAVVGDGMDEITRVLCPGARDASESVLFPVTKSQSRGIEDLRMVRFVEEDGEVHFLGTYTA
jgi:hypothetical protein